jgi:hypothetical protein
VKNVYFAECNGKIKIGISANVASRMSELRTGAGAPLNIIGAVVGDLELEKALHKRLKKYHLDGEWFSDCDETRAVIQTCINNFPAAEVVSREKIKRRKFAAVARVLWPRGTAATIAEISGNDERTAKRWLRGESEPPLSVVLAVIHEMLREQTELNL